MKGCLLRILSISNIWAQGRCFKYKSWILDTITNHKVRIGRCLKPTDTAGYFVRLRETSVVCMRLEEEAEDGTLLMLMRELSVSVVNIGVPTVKRWSLLAILFALFVSLWVPKREVVSNVLFETRIVEGFEDLEKTVSSRHSSGLSSYWHRWIAAGKRHRNEDIILDYHSGEVFRSYLFKCGTTEATIWFNSTKSGWGWAVWRVS